MLIVESATKAKLLQAVLDNQYIVLSTNGHILDLPPKNQKFELIHYPQYRPLRSKHKIIDLLVRTAKKVEQVLIATDPDREGEAIAHHLQFLLSPLKKPVWRLRLNELSAAAIREKIKNPSLINEFEVYAQQARRIIDRTLGFNISPVLRNIETRAVSAGRVQSTALALICKRGKLGEQIPPQTLEFEVSLGKEKGAALSLRLKLKEDNAARIGDKAEVNHLITSILKYGLRLEQIKDENLDIQPLKPLSTGLYLQETTRQFGKLGIQIMKLTQQLYQGLEKTDGQWSGLITYPRTEGQLINPQIQRQIVEYIRTHYSKSEIIQNHENRQKLDEKEAIRPLGFRNEYHPSVLKPLLTKSRHQLYEFIWNRTIACYLKPPKIKKYQMRLSNGFYHFEATFFRLLEPGFLLVLENWPEIQKATFDSELSVNEVFTIDQIRPCESSSRSSCPYDESDLIRELDQLGIGRPSTYAQILPTLLKRNYVSYKNGKIIPTELGQKINNLLVKYFHNILDPSFTVLLETRLDLLAQNKLSYEEVIDYFNIPFKDCLLQFRQAEMQPSVNNLLFCQLCGKPLLKRRNRHGVYLRCSTYPACNFQLMQDHHQVV